MRYENHEEEWREEEFQLRRERERERARAASIARDPFYPPEWAETEFNQNGGFENESD